MTIRIDINSSTPAYRQIADAIRLNLVDGSLRPGDRLPTVRQLSIDLGLHFNTVAEAYRTLAEEGWLDLTRGRGTIVLRRTKPSENKVVTSTYRLRLRQIVAEAQAAGAPTAKIARELRGIADALEEPI